ncbi:hypothetical protein MVEN_01629600 [Mycena venus]|uniref:Uncharacterized protein n=1 Tax=Mycena venus TaxID=2733690 RepID=A0A8H6XNR9_9AGAR|nr:hypothetical protein MVEN_01629600 [Mycena venus]
MSALAREVSPGTLGIIQDIPGLLVSTWAFAAAETFLYGAYLIMIALYVHVLRKRGLGQNRLLSSATIALFVLCTAHCFLALAVVATRTTLEVSAIGNFVGGSIPRRRATVKEALPGGKHGIRDCQRASRCNFYLSLLCYLEFPDQDYPLPNSFDFGCCWLRFPKTFICHDDGSITCQQVLDTLMCFLEVGIFQPYSRLLAPPFYFDLSIGASLFTTFILMGLTVGRIWVLARSARRIFGAQMASTYHTICAMILESGALYLCGGIAFIFFGFSEPFTPRDVTTDGIVLAQLVGIAPTIIAVRVALGQSVENINSFIVPRPRMHSPFNNEVIATAVDPVDDEVLYIRPESVKVEAV